MSALATWVMKKRLHAILGVAGFSIIPLLFWLAAAILGLVVLRKGVAEGFRVLAWGGLPALVLWFYQGDATTFIVLCHVVFLGYLLRTTMSWAWVLTAASFTALLSTFVLPLLMPSVLDFITEVIQKMLAAQEVTELNEAVLYQQTVVAISTVQVMMSVAALFLARKWQAALYNPGGLRKEFHQIRLPIVASLVLGVMVLLGESLDDSYRVLSQVAIPVLVFAGIALVHGVLAKKRIGIVGLVAFYLVGLFVVNIYFMNVMVAIAVADSFIDIRGRIREKPSDSSNS
jgi:hypothetical protein